MENESKLGGGGFSLFPPCLRDVRRAFVESCPNHELAWECVNNTAAKYDIDPLIFIDELRKLADEKPVLFMVFQEYLNFSLSACENDECKLEK